MSVSVEALRPGAEPTFKLIIRHIEVGQMDKFAEFLGQFACQKSVMLATAKPLRPDAEPT